MNDDPFKSRIGALLTGPGGATVAMYAAAVMMPLLVAWGLVDSFFRRSEASAPGGTVQVMLNAEC